MRLFRSHGLGNDYLVLEAGVVTPALVRAICDRHEGVGSDGVLEPVDGAGCDYGLRIHNPDGSEAEKSGNGLRIFADWLVRVRGAPACFTVRTLGGVVTCDVGEQVRVAMGAARLLGVEDLAGNEAHRVDVGNPHAVIAGIPADWEARGAAVEHAVSGRTNVQFVEPVDACTLRVRVWERGAGRTKSSGSSACAVATVGVALGWVRSPVRVEMEGGVLGVVVHPDGRVDLEGPVEPIGRVELDPAWLAARAEA